MAEKIITHPGNIRSIENDKAEVIIMTSSGCASCEIKGSCSASEMEEKIIDVDILQGQEFKVGDSVNVEMKQSQGNWAVLLGYVFPFLVVVISLITLTALNVNEGISGLISLSLLIPYYGIIYLSKGKIKQNFSYRITS